MAESPQRLSKLAQSDAFGGALLIIAAALGLIAANTTETYSRIRDTVVGPASLMLDLSIGSWASDGLLAIFFFVVGLELKREFVTGDLRDPRRAAIPIVAAVGGMIMPALIYLLINIGGAARGWAIPVATDIAFAVAVLAVIGPGFPRALRVFLLTLAIVDDLLAIIIIAVFYTQDLKLGWLLAAVVPLSLFALLVQRRITSPWLLIPLAVATWVLVHASGVHATIAAVALGFTVPVLLKPGEPAPSVSVRLEAAVRPVSTMIAVPGFAFFAAGVSLTGSLSDALSDPVTLGVLCGLVIGKPVGILTATFLITRLSNATLNEELAWPDLVGLSMVAGIGFTVSLLIGGLAFGTDGSTSEHVKLGVLLGSLTSATLATIVLRSLNHQRR